MSRTARLLDLLQLLRRHRRPVSGSDLADTLGISLRTLYRDVATLQAQGACIDGAPGLGYVLKPGFTLPPLMFTGEEIEALALGTRWVAERGDARLSLAARHALSKIAAVLPAELRHELDTSTLLVGPAQAGTAADAHMATMRRAVRMEHKLAIRYRDALDRESSRTVWPFALGFFDRAGVLVAWCELRAGLRHFRTDRITALDPTGERYPRRREALMRDWRRSQGMVEGPPMLTADRN
jgi:predicted DNA-binding transcriptional regulator YafY